MFAKLFARRQPDNKGIEKEIKKLSSTLRTIVDRLTVIENHVNRPGVYHVNYSLQNLVRAELLDIEGLGYPERLTAQRFRLHSQNSEDGITQAIFKEIGTKTRTAIEIGCGQNGGNSGFLVSELGWRGLLVDADPVKLAKLCTTVSPSRAVIVQQRMTRDNVDGLIEEHGFAGEVDFMSIDLDGIDYWLWECLSAASPRVLVMEYNSALGSERAVTIPYSDDFVRAGREKTHYYGASLSALVKLGKAKGYRLVCVEPRGVNAFFLRDDVGPEIPECSIADSFRVVEKHQLKLAALGRDLFEEFERLKLPLVEV